MTTRDRLDSNGIPLVFWINLAAVSVGRSRGSSHEPSLIRPLTVFDSLSAQRTRSCGQFFGVFRDEAELRRERTRGGYRREKMAGVGWRGAEQPGKEDSHSLRVQDKGPAEN